MVFHAILELDPVSPLQLNAALPPKLQEIIEKLLEKDRDLRYQSAADLRGDMKRLKRDIESGRRVVAASGCSMRLRPPSRGQPPAVFAPPRIGFVSSSAAVAAAGRHKLGTGLTGLLAVLVVLLAAAFGIYSLLTRHGDHAVPQFHGHKGDGRRQRDVGGAFARRQIHSQSVAGQRPG